MAEMEMMDVASRLGDTFNSITERVAKLEKYELLHSEIHRLEAAALEATRRELERRLADMNELRAQIEHERGTFVVKDWFERAHLLMETKLTAQVETLETKLTAQVETLETKLTAQVETLETRLKILEMRGGMAAGREEPINAIVKWVVYLLGVILVGLLGHYWK